MRGGVLLSTYHVRCFDFDLGLGEVVAIDLAGVVAGGLLGLVAGLAVAAAQPKARQATLRVAVTRGLTAAAACMTTMAVVAALGAG